MYQLRECQKRAINIINISQKGIIEMCCGSGKSLVIAEIIKQYNVSIVFVPKNSLFDQFCENEFYSKFHFVKINCDNKIYDDISYDKPNIILTNMSSFKNLKNYLLENNITPEFIAYDEAHLYTSTNKRENIENLDKNEIDDFNEDTLDFSCKQIFFTATPNKVLKDNPDLFGEILYRYSYAQGVENGIVVPIEVVFGYTKQSVSEPITEEDMYQSYVIFLKDLIETYHLKRIIFYTSFVGESKTKHFRTSLRKFKKLLKEQQNYTLYFMEANTRFKTRQAMLKNFNSNSNDVQILFTCKTISEGIDCKACDGVILADPSKSIPNNIQRALRCDRTFEGKTKGIVGVPIFLNKDNMDNFLQEDDKRQYVSEQTNGHLYSYQVLLLNMLKNDLDLDILYEHKVKTQELNVTMNENREKMVTKIQELIKEIKDLKEQVEIKKEEIETIEEPEKKEIITNELDELQEILKDKKEELEQFKKTSINQRVKCKVLMNFYDNYEVDYDIQEVGESIEVSLNIKEKMAIEEAFQELLVMKNQGKIINTTSKEQFSNGCSVGNWIGQHRKDLSQKQLEQLDLHDKILNIEDAINELIYLKKNGEKIDRNNKNKLSNGILISSWLGNNRKKLTQKQLEQLDLHDKTLTIDEVFNELLEMKNNGKKINTNTKKELSNGVKIGWWLLNNKKELSQEQLKQLDLHDKTLTIDEVFNELLEMKNNGKKINTKSKELLSNGNKVSAWIVMYKNNLSQEQLKKLDLHDKTLTIDQVFQELLEMKKHGKKIGSRSKEKLSNDMVVGNWIGHNKKKLTVEQLEQLGLKTNNKPKPKKATKSKNYDNLSREELVKLLEKQQKQSQSEYVAPNPDAKNQINKIFSENISKITNGKIIVLDHTDFKSGNAVISSGCDINRLVVPNNSHYEEMQQDNIFGKYVKPYSLQELLEEYIESQEPIDGIYADMMGQEWDILNQMKKCNLSKNCVVGFTISARTTHKAQFTNSFATKLLNKMVKTFKNSDNLIDEEGVFVYGENCRMATSLFRIK